MKNSTLIKTVFTVCIAVISCITGKAQTAKEIFTSPDVNITWLGLDLSNVKYTGILPTSTGGGYMGMGGAAGPFVIKDAVNSMNEVIVAEMDKKYNIKKAFSKKSMGYNLKYAKQLNSGLTNENVMEVTSSSNTNFWKEEDVKKIVSGYKFDSDVKGIGLMFLFEKLNKTGEEATAWVTFFNIDTKEVIAMEKVTGKPKGFGFRNYWLGAFAEMLKDIDGSYYKKWKKKYSM